MTETAWLTCVEPNEMLAFIGERGEERKLRLFACACCRQVKDLLTDARCRQAIDVLERLADGKADWRETGAVRTAALGAAGNAARAIGWAVYWAASRRIGTSIAKVGGEIMIALARIAAEQAKRSGHNQLQAYHAAETHWEREQAAMLRDIFGNPYRSVAFDPDWLRWHDGVVPRLARAIYDGGNFDDLPILADALEEAGCTEESILGHCRQPVSHVRGCWVIDGVLGLS